MIQFEPATTECDATRRVAKCEKRGNKHYSWLCLRQRKRPYCRSPDLQGRIFVRRIHSVKWSPACHRTIAAVLECAPRRCKGTTSAGVGQHRASGYAQSWLPPRLRCFPGKSTSGCTTRMWRVNASLREKVFSSTQSAHRTFCLRALCIVSS